MKYYLLLVAFFISTAQVATAQPLSVMDENFLVAANESNIAELSASQMALTKAKRSQVISFALRMINEHTQDNLVLSALATTKGVSLSNQTNAAHTVALLALDTRRSRIFERYYLEQLIVDHKLSVRLFQYESAFGSDPEVRAYAATRLPTLRSYLSAALQLVTRLRRGIDDEDGNSRERSDRRNAAQN